MTFRFKISWKSKNVLNLKRQTGPFPKQSVDKMKRIGFNLSGKLHVKCIKAIKSGRCLPTASNRRRCTWLQKTSMSEKGQIRSLKKK